MDKDELVKELHLLQIKDKDIANQAWLCLRLDLPKSLCLLVINKKRKIQRVANGKYDCMHDVIHAHAL